MGKDQGPAAPQPRRWLLASLNSGTNLTRAAVDA